MKHDCLSLNYGMLSCLLQVRNSYIIKMLAEVNSDMT